MAAPDAVPARAGSAFSEMAIALPSLPAPGGAPLLGRPARRAKQGRRAAFARVQAADARGMGSRRPTRQKKAAMAAQPHTIAAITGR